MLAPAENERRAGCRGDTGADDDDGGTAVQPANV